MGLRRKATGLSLIFLMLTSEFHVAVLTLILADGQSDTYKMTEGANDAEFVRNQLEKGIPPEEPLLERRYVIPEGMNISHADNIWLAIAPLISLGYTEEELVKSLRESGLPEKLEASDVVAFIDYANLHVSRNPEDGGVSVEIPVACNTSLSSVYYEVKEIRKRVKLYNVTSIKYYTISVDAHELYNITYSNLETNEASSAIMNLEGNLKNHLINVYFPNLESPTFSELHIDFPSYRVMLSLRVLDYRVQKTGLQGKEADCYWIRVNNTLRATRDIWSVMLGIEHGGGWITKPWLILRKGEYVSDHWVKWSEGERLTVELCVEGFRSTFILNFNKTTNAEQSIINETLSEDKLKEALNQPSYGKLNLSKVPKSWSVKFAGEKVTNETVWVINKEYEWLMRLGWRKGNSLFIDSGEAEWEYSATNKTLGSCSSIRLFYNPLKVNKGELVHGVTLRNYADTNVSYTLRLRTTSNYFFFFSKVQEGSESIVASKESTSSLLLIQQEPAVGDAVLEVVKDGRVVAAVKVSLALKATMFWKGFWDGLASKLPGIMVTAGVMIAMSFLIPHAYVRQAYYFLLGLGVFTSLLEVALDVAEAYRARDEILSLAEAFENRSSDFLARGEVEHAAESRDFALTLRREVNETMSNLWLNVLTDLAIGVSLDEIRIALGLKEPLARDEFERQYSIGYARGKVTGATISCILYVTLFIMVNRVKAERIGQHLTTSQILRMITKGFYNWITPSIWDATLMAIEKKGAKFLGKAVDLLLGNKYSKKFGETIGDLLGRIKAEFGESSKIDYALEITSGFSKQVLESIPSKESSSRILNTIGSILEAYSLNEVEEKGETIVRSITSIWIKDGDEAVSKLNEWLNANSDKAKVFADEILLAIKGNAAKGVGLKIREIADNYFEIKVKYGEDVAKYFLDSILENPDALESLVAKMSNIEHYKWTELHEATLRNGDGYNLNLGKGHEIGQGTYRVKISWEYENRRGTVEFVLTKKTRSTNIWIPRSHVESILGEIGMDEAIVRIISAEITIYVPEIHFSRKFFSGTEVLLDILGKKVAAYDEFYRTVNKIPIESWSFRSYEGKAVLDVITEAKDIDGKPLIFVFYDDGLMEIRKAGSGPYPVDNINVNRGRWRITYQAGGGRIRGSTYIVGRNIIVPQRIELADDMRDVSGYGTIALKERIFLSGYYLQGLENVNMEVNDEERLVIRVCFTDENGNYKSAFCLNPQLKVGVPKDATRIEYIEVLKYQDTLNNFAYCLNMLKHDPLDTFLVGWVAEIWTYKNQDLFLDEFCEYAGIPKGAIIVDMHKKVAEEGPDLIMTAAQDIIDRYGNTFKKNDMIAIISVKSTTTHDLELFKTQVEKGREWLTDFLADPGRCETAMYGISVVLDYAIWTSSEEGLNVPKNIGGYNNPYVEIIGKGG